MDIYSSNESKILLSLMSIFCEKFFEWSGALSRELKTTFSETGAVRMPREDQRRIPCQGDGPNQLARPRGVIVGGRHWRQPIGTQSVAN
jgi:hypothetical protein